MNWPTEYGGLAARVGSWHLDDMLRYALAFLTALIAALALTPGVRRLARACGMIDRPDARRIHTAPTPRGGGVAVFIAFHLGLAVTVWLNGEFSPLFDASWRLRFFWISGLLVLLGLCDDAFNLKPWLKLAGQIVVALLLYQNGLNFSAFFATHFPAWINCLVTILWIVGAINAFNLIDGLDGLAAGLACIAAVGMACGLFARGMSGAAIPFLALAGATLGFLRYNFNPASVFLGDTGSMFLGLTLATLPLMTASKQELLASLGIPLAAMGLPIFDTAIAIWRRAARAALPSVAHAGASRMRIMQADREHLHHRVLAQTMNQRRAAMLLYAVNVVLVAVALAAVFWEKKSAGILLLAFITAAFIIVRHLTRVELWDTGRMLLARANHSLSSRLIVPLYVVYDTLMLCLAWLFTRWTLRMPLTKTDLRESLPVFLAATLIALALARAYNRVWARALLREYALAAVAIVAGVSAASGVSILLGIAPPETTRFAVVMALCAIALLMGGRLAAEVFRESLAVIERLTLLDKPATTHVLVCGGGTKLRLFMREKRQHVGDNTRVIIGILDDDINLRGRIICGHRVLGEFDDLPALAQRMRVDLVLITASVSDARRQRLAQLAQRAKLPLKEWKLVETDMDLPSSQP